MKAIKILFVFASLIFASQMMAQDATISRNGTNFNIALDAGDTLSNNSTTLSKTIGVGAKQAVQLYSIQVDLDKLSGTPAASWVLAGSMDNVEFVTITTVPYIGAAADTTFYFTDVSTGVAWPYMRIQGTESGTAKSQMTRCVGRFIDKVR